jgi:hypothetical protein
VGRRHYDLAARVPCWTCSVVDVSVAKPRRALPLLIRPWATHLADAHPFGALLAYDTGFAIVHRHATKTFHTSHRSALLIRFADLPGALEGLADVVDAVLRIAFSPGFAGLAIVLESFADVIDTLT